MKKKYNVFRASLSSEKAFSLIELALGLAVLGAFTSGILYSYNTYRNERGDIDTKGRLRSAEYSINAFYTQGNGFYPCPAALNTAEGDANFGVAGDCTLANIPLCTSSTWKTPTGTGICKTSDTVDAIIIGGIPFATLKLPFNDALDTWNNRLIYAVTHKKTALATFDSHAGAIDLWTMDDPLSSTRDNIPDSKGLADPVDLFLYSTGPNGINGFTKDGLALADCGAASTGYETENCDYDRAFLNDSDPTYASGAKSFVQGATYFDDITVYKQKVLQSTWFAQPSSASDVLTLSDNVGIGTTNPQYTLHVVGNIYAPDQVRTAVFCDASMANCLDPDVITGTRTNMTCNTDTAIGDQGVMRLANSRVYCASPVDSTSGNPPSTGDAFVLNMSLFTSTNCLTNSQYAAGFDSSGRIICRNP